jgi:hypothetical protein
MSGSVAGQDNGNAVDPMDDLDENLQLEFIETICTEKKKLGKDFGKGRGLNTLPSEAQKKAVEKLASKLTFRESKDGDSEPFDIFSKPRVILYEGKVHKKSKFISSRYVLISSSHYQFKYCSY